MNWTNHIDTKCFKLSRRLGLLRRVKYNLPKETLSMLYNAIALAHFVIYGHSSAISLKRMQVLQNRGTRMCLGCDYRTHSNDMLLERKWLNIKDRVNFRCFFH